MSPTVRDDVHMISWNGNNKRILAYPVDHDQQFNVACTYPSNLSIKQPSNDNSAAVVGTWMPSLSELSGCQKLTLLLGSIQPKDLFRRRSQHIQ